MVKDKGKVITEAVNMMSIVTNHAKRITDHYVRAIEKHPYFCDKMDTAIILTKEDLLKFITRDLENKRRRIRFGCEDRNLCWSEILECELLGAEEAYLRGDKAQVVKKLYASVAVLLRTIDVLEGRQKLGKPERGGEV